MNRTIGIDMTTGSLGQGFSCAVGVALGSKLEEDGATVYTLTGDGERARSELPVRPLTTTSLSMALFSCR